MRRREFTLLLGGAAAWSVAARAQQPAMPVVGILGSTPPDDAATTSFLASFSEGLRDVGYVVGQNVTIDFRSAEVYDRLPALAADLVHSKVAVIVPRGAVNAALAAKAATSTIPIVFVIGSDPVEHGLVASLNRPGNNITGVTTTGSALLAKKLELLRELIPNAISVGFLVNPANPNTERETQEFQALARAGGWVLHVIAASADSDFDPAFAALMRFRVSAFLHSSDVLFTSRYRQLVALAARHSLPAIHGRRDAVDAGGLMSYGARPADMYRLAGSYTGRILKGENPADLPVQLPARFVLIVNLKTAKAMGITVPTSILLRADDVIE